MESEDRFLDVATPALQSLSSESFSPSQLRFRHYRHLTAITRLELLGFDFSRVDVLWRQSAVQELIAIRCTHVHAPFLLSGAMPALRKLHAEEAEGHTQRSFASTSERQAAITDLMDRPQFQQISGLTSFFTAGLKRLLVTWDRAGFTERTIECRTTTSHDKMTVWTKPGQ